MILNYPFFVALKAITERTEAKVRKSYLEIFFLLKDQVSDNKDSTVLSSGACSLQSAVGSTQS